MLIVALLMMVVGSTPGAAEYDFSSATMSSWRFASPSGNLSDEPSGLAASRKNPGNILWENEAPRNGLGMLYAVNSAGLQKALKFRPSGSMFDFEDMAIGPCNGSYSGSCVWVGDIGKLSADFSASNKNTFWLYRMAEPDIAKTASGSELPVTGSSILSGVS